MDDIEKKGSVKRAAWRQQGLSKHHYSKYCLAGVESITYHEVEGMAI